MNHMFKKLADKQLLLFKCPLDVLYFVSCHRYWPFALPSHQPQNRTMKSIACVLWLYCTNNYYSHINSWSLTNKLIKRFKIRAKRRGKKKKLNWKEAVIFLINITKKKEKKNLLSDEYKQKFDFYFQFLMWYLVVFDVNCDLFAI